MMGPCFEHPEVLLLLLLIPLLCYLYRLYWRKRKEAALKFSALSIVREAEAKAGNRYHGFRAHLPFILLILTLLLISIAVADPMIPLKRAKQGVNVVLAIDDSGSMQATDYSPTRLEAAKHAAETLIRSLKPKDNVGIVAFESSATTVCYLTPFKDRAIEKLSTIEPHSGGTAIGEGLKLAVEMAASIPNMKRVVILLSDGVNNAGAVTPAEAIKFARAESVQVYTIGLGSNKPVLIGYDLFGNPQYAELDEETLQRIATETGGEYFKSVDENTLSEIYARLGENIKREWEETSIKDWFVIASFIVVLVDIYIIYGRYRVVV